MKFELIGYRIRCSLRPQWEMWNSITFPHEYADNGWEVQSVWAADKEFSAAGAESISVNFPAQPTKDETQS